MTKRTQNALLDHGDRKAVRDSRCSTRGVRRALALVYNKLHALKEPTQKIAQLRRQVAAHHLVDARDDLAVSECQPVMPKYESVQKRPRTALRADAGIGHRTVARRHGFLCACLASSACYK